MSVRAMELVFGSSQSTGNSRLVLIALADVADQEGNVTSYRRSRTYIADRCNCSEATVRRAIADLVKIGELQVIKQGTGREQSDYKITVTPRPEQIAPPQVEPAGVATPPPQGDSPDDPGVATLVPPSSRSSRPSPSLPGMDAPAPVVKVPKPEQAIARRVWDESGDHKPATPFIAVQRLAKRFLDAGHDADAIVAAMLVVPTISTGWVEAELKKGRRGPQRRPITEPRDGESGEMAL